MNTEYAKLIQDENHGKSWKEWQVKLRLYGSMGRFIARKITIFRLRYLCLIGPLRFYMTTCHPILNRVYCGSQYDYLRNRLDLLLRMVDHAEMSNKPGAPDLERESVSFAYKIYYAIRAIFPIRHLREGRQERKLKEYSRQFMVDSTKIHADFAKSSSSEGFCSAGCC